MPTFVLRLSAAVLCFSASLAFAIGGARLSGKVVDANSGSPVQNATVKLVERGTTTTTDAKGEFSFPDVPSGNYHLEGSVEDYYPLSVAIRFSANEAVAFDLPMRSRASLMDRNVVTVNGYVEPVKDTARAVGIIDNPDISDTKLVGLDEVLNSISGVKAENQSGSEQVRVSIRGRNVRNSFGIIGIKLLVDGIPETDASGETPDITGIDMAAADHIEVVKGPMSARYGTSAAGIVNLISRAGAGAPEIDILNYGGSYGFQRNQLSWSGSSGLFDYFVDGSRTVEDGYREHSAFYAYRTSTRFGFKLAPSVKMNVFLKFNHSNDQLPGPLSQQAYAADPNQVEPLYGQYVASENIVRSQGALTIEKDFGADQVLSGMVFSRILDYELPLPYVYLDGHRPETGLSGRYTFRVRTSFLTQRISFGVDYEHERDDLKDFFNNFGTPVPPPEEDDVRRVYNLGTYVFDEVTIGQKATITAGLNYSRVNFNFQDLLAGGTLGVKLYERPTYVVGAAYHLRPNLTAYANVSTGLETPTLSELGIGVTGTAGFNPTLEPELSTTYELGGLFTLHNRASINVALFRADVNNEIVPTGIGVPQQTFDNAAKTVHNGEETAFKVRLYHDLDWNLAYTYSDFYYRQYTNLLGEVANSKQIPALPRNHLFSSLEYHNRYGLNGGVTYEFVGKMFADDLNDAVSDKYMTANVNVSYVRPLAAKVGMRLMFGINNFNNQRYVDYVVANGTYGEYYYPAAGRNYFGSLQLTWLASKGR